MLPNILSAFRLVGTFFIIFFYNSALYLQALILFIIAGFSDFFDGYIARKYNSSSFFGAILDAVADKVFICSLLILLYLDHNLPLWFMLLAVSRDVGIVIGSLFYLIQMKKQMNILFISKLNSTLQIFLITSILIEKTASTQLNKITSTLLILSFLSTIISGILYAKYFIDTKNGD